MRKPKHFICLLVLSVYMAMLMAITSSAASTTVSVMYKGDRKTLTSTVKTGNPNIVKVKKKNGVSTITAKKQGTTTLKYYNGKKLIRKTKVLVLKKNGIKYDQSPLTLKKGASKTVKCTAYKACTITYKSSNAKIATVSASGVIKAKKAGSCTIKAKVSYKGVAIKSFSKKVTVTKASSSKTPASDQKETEQKKQIKSVTCSIESKKIQAGETYPKSAITVTATYTDGSKQRVTDFTYSMSAVKDGKAVLTVKYAGQTFTFDIEVADAQATLSSISAECAKSSVYEGYQFTLNDFVVYGHYSDGSKKRLYNYTISTTYSSTDGKYTIVVSSSGKETTVTVPVSGSQVTPPQPETQKPGTTPDTPKDPETGKTAVGIEVTFSKTEVPDQYDFQLEDFTVYTVYSDGSKVKASSYGFKATYEDGYYIVTVTSGNFSETLKIKTTGGNPAGKTIDRVTFALRSSTIKVGEMLPKNQIIVTVIYKDGTQKTVTDFTYDFTPQSTPGRYPVNVTWGNAKGTLMVTVEDENALRSVDIKFARDFLYLGEIPDKEDIIVTGTYSDGSTKRIDDFTFSFEPAKKHGDYSRITVNVAGKSAVLQVRTYDSGIPSSMTLTVNRAVIGVNENIDPSTIILNSVYRDGTTKVETDFTIDFTPKQEPGKYPVVVTCKGYTFNFEIEVVEH